MGQVSAPVEWSIVFFGGSPKYREQAHYIQGAPDNKAFRLARNEILINFIDKLNASFKKAAESLLAKEPISPEQKRQAEEIQEQFNIVDQWIAQLRKQFPKTPE